MFTSYQVSSIPALHLRMQYRQLFCALQICRGNRGTDVPNCFGNSAWPIVANGNKNKQKAGSYVCSLQGCLHSSPTDNCRQHRQDPFPQHWLERKARPQISSYPEGCPRRHQRDSPVGIQASGNFWSQLPSPNPLLLYTKLQPSFKNFGFNMKCHYYRSLMWLFLLVLRYRVTYTCQQFI